MSGPDPAAAATERPKETAEEKKARKEAEKKVKAEEKARKEAEKAARAAQRGQKAAILTAPDPSDPHGSHYGDAALIQSDSRSETTWTQVADLDTGTTGKEVRVRGRLHATRGQGKSCFVVLRQRMATVQCTIFADEADGGTVSKLMVKYAQQIPKESILDVVGVAVQPASPVDGCTQQHVELKVSDIHVISRSSPLPFEMADAARAPAAISEAAQRGEVLGTVEQDLRLNMRHMDLRTPASQAIFRIQSAVCQSFRNSLSSQGFQEIHTPKLLGGASEGGAEAFTLDYFGSPACLAMSPQLYKQMAICADFERVFEIGPVFRAENSFTHRHMCEFTGMDVEMEIKEHYFEVIDVIEALFADIFKGIEDQCKIELQAVQQQFPFEPFVMNPMRFTFAQIVQMLQENGFPDHSVYEDINTTQEKLLGKIIKAKHGTDFYTVTEFPVGESPKFVRPFYTMVSPKDEKLTNSFDVFMRGEEIISGAQRIHTPELLEERAKMHGIRPETIRSYIDSFKLGAPPHGGAGVGMERVVMLYLGLGNIRQTAMFPRDPKRLTP
eukprot:jgi/Ulvmu1/8236/UM041_0046.1